MLRSNHCVKIASIDTCFHIPAQMKKLDGAFLGTTSSKGFSLSSIDHEVGFCRSAF
jgi:hypothetical protein